MNETARTPARGREGFVPDEQQPKFAQDQGDPREARRVVVDVPQRQQVSEKPRPKLENPPPDMADSPAATDAPEPVQETWPIVVKLMYKPILDSKGSLVHELSFREPRGGDINRYGNPARIDGNGEIVIDERKMHWMMSGLCGVLPPLLEALDPRDWNSCAYRLRGFFLPDTRGW